MRCHTACTASLILWALLAAFTGAGAQASKSAARKTPAKTAAQHEAQVHYKTALIALQNNDLVVAEKELQASVDAAPSNATYWLNLAEVQAKRDDIKEALTSLGHARKNGVPAALREKADSLEASLAYQSQNDAQKAQRAALLQPYIGTWTWDYHWEAGDGFDIHFRGDFIFSGLLMLVASPDKRTLVGDYISHASVVYPPNEDEQKAQIQDCEVDYKVYSFVANGDSNVNHLYLAAQSKTQKGSDPGLDDRVGKNGCDNPIIGAQATAGRVTGSTPEMFALTLKSATSLSVEGIYYWPDYKSARGLVVLNKKQ